MEIEKINKSGRFQNWITITNKLIEDENQMSSGNYVKTGGILNLKTLYVNGDIECDNIFYTGSVDIMDGGSKVATINRPSVSIDDFESHRNNAGNPHKAAREWFVGTNDNMADSGFLLMDNTDDMSKPVSDMMRSAIANTLNTKKTEYNMQRLDVSATDTANMVKGSGIYRFINDIVTNAVIDRVYPVGSIYTSYDNSTDPKELFGRGEWVRLPEGRVLIGAGTGYSAGSTGGEASYKLTVHNLPEHTHSVSVSTSGIHSHGRGDMYISGSYQSARFGRQDWLWSEGAFGIFPSNQTSGKKGGYGNAPTYRFVASDGWRGTWSSWSGGHGHTVTMSNRGDGSQSVSLMQPYLAVYMWRRTK